MDTKDTKTEEAKTEVPTVDPNATLEIEKITKSPDSPTVDKNAPLKVEEIEEKEEDGVQEKSNKMLFLAGGGILLIILLATLGFFVLSSKEMPQENKKTEIKTETPTPTPKPALIRSEWSLEVLNGSGVAGVAKKLAERLREKGYQVISAGNADKDSYTESQIYVSSAFKERIDLLIADVKDVVKIASIAGELKDSTASARIIVGKK